MKLSSYGLVAVLVAALAAVTCVACANSVLRNAAEAGMDTVMERSTPTPVR